MGRRDASRGSAPSRNRSAAGRLASSAWLEALNEIVETGKSFQPERHTLPVHPERPIPFEDCLLPAVIVGRAALANRCRENGDEHSFFCPEAQLTQERGLLHKLAVLCAPTLTFEFERQQPFGATLLRRLEDKVPSGIKASDHRYRAFVERLLRDGGLSLFETYPVLGRLVATSVMAWVECSAELLQRLSADAADLSIRFADGQALGQVSTLKTSLSDPHRGGRTVAVLGFTSGLRLVYKPKDLGLEQAFQHLLRWCNEHLQDLPFRLTTVFERSDYGWVEFVEHQPCSDAAAVQRFYQRSGMLLCLLHALRAIDCHCENLIACGEHPVLVDMEALIHPETQSIEESQPEQTPPESAQLLLFNSVLRTGMLPAWRFSADRKFAYDFSGMAGGQPHDAAHQQPAWCDINTDRMSLRQAPAPQASCDNIPMLDGVALSLTDHVPDICFGFERMYRLLQTQMQTLLGCNSPLNVLRDRQVRFLFRETQLYGDVLKRLRSPQHLRDGVAFSVELDQLSRAFLVADDKPELWPLLGAELQALERLDVPLFMTSTSTGGVQLDSGSTLPSRGISRGYDDVLAQLRAFSHADLTLQIGIIQSSLHMSVAHVVNTGEVQSHHAEDIVSTELQQFITAARSIADELQAHALPDADGSANWFGMSFAAASNRYQLTALGDSLYDGRGGVALFLAALHKSLGDASARQLALAALQPLRVRIRSISTAAGARWARAVGIGGGCGLGSMVYALVKVGQLLGEETLLADAARLACGITPELIAHDKQLDVLGGAAGAILGLLALLRARPGVDALDAAVACGRHLLTHRHAGAGAARAWRTLDEQCLAGFSHGAAGIAYALERLHMTTGDEAFLSASTEGVAYERSLFSAMNANWPDLRGVAQGHAPSYLAHWCHGACGIGLARLGSVSLLADEGRQRDVDAALAVVLRSGLQTMDNLCCGNFGRIEMLLVAACELGQSDLATHANQQAAAVLERARVAGGLRLFANLPISVRNPGFFQGTAGIGYQLLRLAQPSLPCVLLWE
jgi:type 2 lantibiotic biosynthesis protein LanM